MNAKVNAVLRMRRFIVNLPEFIFFLSNLILDSFMAWERIDPGGGEPSFNLRSKEKPINPLDPLPRHL